MEFIDTHCHIHFKDYGLNPDEVIASAKENDVNRLICVGCTKEDSKDGALFVQSRPNTWASIGIHPHESHNYVRDKAALTEFSELIKLPKIVAVGECGLDYFYQYSSKVDQKKILRMQIELALANDVPLIFHVRDAFDDFWPIFDEYTGIRGVIHSFSATDRELDAILKRDLFVGINGIATFTKRPEQIEAIRRIPLNSLLLETDAPFLTPVPERGKICEPKHVANTAAFLAGLRGENVQNIAEQTTKNAVALFKLEN